MSRYELFIGPIVSMILVLGVAAWMGIWVSRAGQPRYRFVTVVFNAAIVLSILKVGFLWHRFSGYIPGSTFLELVSVLVISFPESLFVPGALAFGSGEGEWTTAGMIRLSFILILRSIILVITCSGLVLAARRVIGERSIADVREKRNTSV